MELRRNSGGSQQAPQFIPSPSKLKSGGILTTILIVVLIITCLVASTYLGVRLASGASNGNAVKSKQYQAVFLTNGQVYFGKLKNIDNSYVRLSDIYYLQVQQQVQPKENSAANSNEQPQVSLAKLGSELHGPEDTMYISRDQILFWENLKSDGKVSKAISEYSQK